MQARLLRLLLGSPAALVIPVEAADAVVRRWRGDRVADDAGALPPHVTILWPFLHTRRLDAAVVAAIETITRTTAPFAFRLSGVGRFPGVVHLTVDPVEPFLALIAALQRRWPEHPPYAGEHTSVIPHVSVELGPGADERDLSGLGGDLPVSTTAETLLLAVQDRAGRWHERQRFNFGATSP